MADDDGQSFDQRAGAMFDAPAAPAAPPMPAWAPSALAAGPPQPQQQPAGGGALSMDGLKALQDAGGQLQQQKTAALAPMLKQIQQQGGEMASMQPPALQAAPKAPQASQIGKGMMEYMQIATVMAALAGGLSRRGTTTALNAFSGAIQGFAQGKFQIFQQNMEEWKAASDEVSTNNRSMLDQYDRIWKNKKLDIDQKMEEYKLVASQHQDEISWNLANQRNYTMLAQENEKIREFQDRHDQAAQRIEIEWQKMKDQHDQMTTTFGPEDVEFYAEQLNATGKFPGNMGYGKAAAANKQAIMTKARELAHGAGQTGGDVVGQQAGYKANAATLNKLTQQQAAIRQFENTAIRNGDVLVQLANKVDATGIPVLEKWRRAGKKATGDPDVAQFNAQISLYRNEVAKIITSPNLTGVLSDHARAEAETFLTNADSAQQITAVVSLLKGDMGRRQQSLEQEINDVKGQLTGKGAANKNLSATPADVGGGGWSVEEVK